MGKRKKLFVVYLSICLLLFMVTGCKNKAQEKIFLNRPKFDVVGFYVNDNGPTNSFSSLQKYAKYIDTLSPTWLLVEKNGYVTDTTSEKVLSFARKNGLKVVPLVNVVNSNDTVLLDSAVRKRAISNIISLIKKHDYDGVNIDFEFIPHGPKNYVSDKDYLTKFIAILDSDLKKMGKTLDISVIPHYQVSPSIAGIYDYHKLAPIVDHVTLMTYDRHYASSPPGPVSPLEWVDYNVRDALKEGFQPYQICLGVATYGYNWPANSSGGFSEPTKAIVQKAESLGVNIRWSEKYQEPYYLYNDPVLGGTREIWFENSNTLAEKIKLVKDYKLHGICIWRLGFETPDFWKVIAENRQTP